jgi:hypothetical protein
VTTKLGQLPVAPTETPATILTLASDLPATVTDDILDIALDRRGLTLRPGHRTRLGSATIAALPTTKLSTLDVLTQLVPAIESAVGTYNSYPTTAIPARLRIGVHRGEVAEEPDWTAADVSTVYNLSDAVIVGEILAAAPRADCVVVTSRRIYDDLIGPGLPGVSRANYRQIIMPDGTPAWLRVPGYPKPPDPRMRPKAPPRPTPDGPAAHVNNYGQLNHQSKVNNFNAPVNVHQIGDTYYQWGSSDGRQ